MKNIKKIISYIMVSLMIIAMMPNLALAVEDGEGPYKITLNMIDKETKETVKGSYFKLLKTHVLSKDGDEVLLREAKIIKPQGVELREDGSFKIKENTVITIPKESGKGIYNLEEVSRAYGYYPYEGVIDIEFPKIKDGEYEPGQNYNINIEATKITAGFNLEIFAENKDGEVDNYLNPVDLEIYKIGSDKDPEERRHIRTVKYSSVEDENKVKGLDEGSYEMSIGEVTFPGVIQPKNRYRFDITYNSIDKEAVLTDKGYAGLDSASEIEDLSYRLYLYAEPIIDPWDVSGSPLIKTLVGDEIKTKVDLYATNIIRNFDNPSVIIPEESQNLVVVGVSGAEKMGNKYIVPLDKHGKKEILIDAVVKDAGAKLNVPFELKISEDDNRLNKVIGLFNNYQGSYGSLTGEIKLQTGPFTYKDYIPKGKFLVFTTKDHIQEGDVKVEDGKLSVTGLKAGEYKLYYMPGGGENVDGTDDILTFTITSDSDERLKGIDINTTIPLIDVKYIKIRNTVVVIIGIFLFINVFFGQRILQYKRRRRYLKRQAKKKKEELKK